MIERLLLAIGRIPFDKVLHFFGGLLLGQAGFILGGQAWGLVAAPIAGAGKEIYDHFHPSHQVEWWDFIWTTLGGLVGWLLLVWFQLHRCAPG